MMTEFQNSMDCWFFSIFCIRENYSFSNSVQWWERGKSEGWSNLHLSLWTTALQLSFSTAFQSKIKLESQRCEISNEFDRKYWFSKTKLESQSEKCRMKMPKTFSNQAKSFSKVFKKHFYIRKFNWISILCCKHWMDFLDKKAFWSGYLKKDLLHTLKLKPLSNDIKVPLLGLASNLLYLLDPTWKPCLKIITKHSKLLCCPR